MSDEMILLPKGVIMLALGGYVGEEQGKNTIKNSAFVHDMLLDFMQRSEQIITVSDGKLVFEKFGPLHTDN